MKKSTHTNKPIINLLYLLDESGSMGSIRSSVIDGFNEYINGLKNKGGFKVTLTKFDSNGLRTPYTALDIKKVPKLNADTYVPGAITPLYDSVVESVENLAKEMTDGQPVLVVIMTDGLENASLKHNEQCLRELIGKLQAKGNWTFVFMGANQDSWQVASNLGIAKGNTINWQATNTGTLSAFSMMASNTTNYAISMENNAGKGIGFSTTGFFGDAKGDDQS